MHGNVQAVDSTFTIDDSFTGNHTDANAQPASQPPNLLDVNQFLDSVRLILYTIKFKFLVKTKNVTYPKKQLQVLETTNHVGRHTAPPPSGMTYMDVASQCEALQEGKEKRMNFVSSPTSNETSAVFHAHEDSNADLDFAFSDKSFENVSAKSYKTTHHIQHSSTAFKIYVSCTDLAAEWEPLRRQQ